MGANNVPLTTSKNCGGAERAEYAVGVEDSTLDRGIVGEQGDDHVACAASALAGLRL
jgi:hypothetical protein